MNFTILSGNKKATHIKHFLLVILILSFSSLCRAQFAGGTGTADDPWQIATAEQLDNIRNYLGSEHNDKHFIQTALIDLGVPPWSTGTGWEPIGSVSSSFFGTYDGNGFTIDGMLINRPAHDQQALFGCVNGGTISNLGVTDVSVTGNSYVGALLGRGSQAEIDNCFSTGSVTGLSTEILGGTGGLIGRISSHAIISNSYSECQVTGTEAVGGLIGATFIAISVVNCYSTGDVNGDQYVGGLIGSYGFGTSLLDSYSSGNVSGLIKVGGLTGSGVLGISNSYYNYESVLINDEHQVTMGALDNDLFNTWLANDLNLDIDDYLIFNGENYLIETVGDFKRILAFGQFPEYDYLLTAELDLTAYPDLFIPCLRGDFDGDGHLINNLSLNYPANSNIGLFGTIDGGSVYNVFLTDVDISGAKNVGGLTGYAHEGLLVNSYTTGNVTGHESTGGLAGYLWSSTITNCHSSTIVSGLSVTGGLIGWSNGVSLIENSYSFGSVTGIEYTGGLIGWKGTDAFPLSIIDGNVNQGHGKCSKSRERDSNMNPVIENSFNLGSVEGGDFTGGLTGLNNSVMIISTYNLGNVLGVNNVGGLTGSTFDSVITNSYNRGSVQGENYVGGLVGEASDSPLSYCYSSGSVTGDDNTGGLIGARKQSFVQYCYWDIEVSGQTVSAGGHGRTTDEMTYPYAGNTYVDWDFDVIWGTDFDYSFNDGYPYLLEPPLSTGEEEIAYSVPHHQLKVYPNPFNPETNIIFSLARDSCVRLKVYNIRGQLVRTLIEETLPAGEHLFLWNDRDGKNSSVSSGVYFLSFLVDEEIIENRKMMLLK